MQGALSWGQGECGPFFPDQERLPCDPLAQPGPHHEFDLRVTGGAAAWRLTPGKTSGQFGKFGGDAQGHLLLEALQILNRLRFQLDVQV